jgi:hypothetical protein
MHTKHSDGYQRLTSFNEVVNALGGVKAVATMTRSSRTSVYNWRQAGQFPARHYRIMREALSKRGYTAGLRLWAFTPAKKVPVTATVAA